MNRYGQFIYHENTARGILFWSSTFCSSCGRNLYYYGEVRCYDLPFGAKVLMTAPFCPSGLRYGTCIRTATPFCPSGLRDGKFVRTATPLCPSDYETCIHTATSLCPSGLCHGACICIDRSRDFTVVYLWALLVGFHSYRKSLTLSLLNNIFRIMLWYILSFMPGRRICSRLLLWGPYPT